MTQATPSGALRSRGAERIDGPFISFDVPFELARLRAEGAYAAEGHAGRTLTKYPDLRVVLEAMTSGARMPLHEPAERMTLQIVLGQARVWLRHGDNVELSEGSFAAIDAALVDEIECLEECAFLLTLAWPPTTGRAQGGEGAGGGT